VRKAGHAVQMAKEVFVDALFALARDADRGWPERESVVRSDADRE
jgi:hypothetical protein